MQIPIFQIVVPFLSFLFILSWIMRRLKSKATIVETLLHIFFWLGIGIFALFPDIISKFAARSLGFESDVNAIIFLVLAALIFMQFTMFGLIKDHEKAITDLTRKLAIKEGLTEIE